jgi:methylmalonyl-CoA decarboxylase subunit alpha
VSQTVDGRIDSAPDSPDRPVSHLAEVHERMLAGGAAKYHEANARRGKLFARDRIARLVDPGSFVEDGLYANALADGLPADGVVTGTATVDGRPVAVMANDSTVKARGARGPWRRSSASSRRRTTPACR